VAFSIATINVNGIRAAVRRGMLGWLEANQPDLIAIQEVRAPSGMIESLLGDGWHVAHDESSVKGRAGVAIASRTPLVSSAAAVGDDRFLGSGRWIEAAIDTPDGRGLTAVSTYVHTGQADDPARMEEKHAFLSAGVQRLADLAATGRHVLAMGDLNVAHRQVDIKNWKGNVGKAGYLPEEQAHLDRLFDGHGFTDLGRHFGGDGPGPYTWWSWRGKAYDNDAGWRIDYQISSPDLTALAKDAVVHRAPTYAERWSDHAPLVVTFDL